MENNIEIYEKFISYHRGVCTDEEKREVEDLIVKDAEAKKEFEDWQLLEENIRLYYWQKEAKELLKEPKIIKRQFLWRVVAVAASILVFSTLSFMALNKNYFSDIIIEESILKSPSVFRQPKSSPQEEAYNLFVAGKVSYYANDFRAAINAYTTALKTPNLRNQIHEAIQWHLCVAYLRNNQASEAEKILKDLDKIENPKYDIGTMNKAKIRTQIFLKKLF